MMHRPKSGSARRNVLRAAGVVMAVGLIVLWITFAREIFTASGFVPAPSGFMLPLFFCSLALGAGVAALRGEGVVVALAGGLALPIGLLLLPFPGMTRGIGLLDLGLIAVGVMLMRTHDAALDESVTADARTGDPLG